jgi:hypothetical protein
MGELCIHVLAAKSPGPIRLRPSNVDPLCRRCKEAKYCPDDIEILRYHRRLLAAASALLDHKVTEEYIIIPTLVFATLSDRDEVYARIGERLATVREHDEDWKQLYKKFSLRLGEIKPKAAIGDVPVVWRPPVAVSAVGDSDGELVDAILVEVHKLIGPREVRAFYSDALEAWDLPSESGRGLIAWTSSDKTLQMSVRPEEDPALHPILRYANPNIVYGPHGTPRRLQGRFAHPADVEAVYVALKGRGYAKGPGGGNPPEYYNAIPTVVAWYLGKRAELQGIEGQKIRRLVKACLEEPRKERIPELKRRWQPWRDLGQILPHLKQTEREFRAHTDLNNPYGSVHKTF